MAKRLFYQYGIAETAKVLTMDYIMDGYPTSIDYIWIFYGNGNEFPQPGLLNALSAAMNAFDLLSNEDDLYKIPLVNGEVGYVDKETFKRLIIAECVLKGGWISKCKCFGICFDGKYTEERKEEDRQREIVNARRKIERMYKSEIPKNKPEEETRE